MTPVAHPRSRRDIFFRQRRKRGVCESRVDLSVRMSDPGEKFHDRAQNIFSLWNLGNVSLRYSRCLTNKARAWTDPCRASSGLSIVRLRLSDPKTVVFDARTSTASSLSRGSSPPACSPSLAPGSVSSPLSSSALGCSRGRRRVGNGLGKTRHALPMVQFDPIET